MADDTGQRKAKGQDSLREAVGQKERRKLLAQKRGQQDVWSGLGYFGLVGWAVAIPTVLGIFLGLWLDKTLDSQRSWTLTFLLAGLVLGMLNAWFWVQRQRNAIDRERQQDSENNEVGRK